MYECYILTDAEGFTTCVAAPGHIEAEVKRCCLIAPVMVYHWQRNHVGWVECENFQWR